MKPIWLRREGQYVVVLIEAATGQWVELIRENVDSPFSHIIEPAGIKRRVEDARESGPASRQPEPLPNTDNAKVQE